MFLCFMLHVTTSKNVLQMFYTKMFYTKMQMFYTKTVAKMLPNNCKTFLQMF